MSGTHWESAPLRTYRRQVRLPAGRVDDWALIARMVDTLQEAATESGWTAPETRIEVIDQGGSYTTDSVARAAALAGRSRHRVTAVTARFQETAPDPVRRTVRSSFTESGSRRSITVSGPREPEVIGLAGLLKEVLTATPRPTLGRAAGSRIGRWWTSQHVGTQLFVGVAGSLIASILAWLVLMLI